MGPYLYAIEILVTALLVALILLQSRTAGLGSVFGQDNAVSHTRRGAEQLVFRLTIIIAVLFCLLSLVTVRFVS